jgi:NADH:ubiquinone oxidoreductase subunit 6 (subunit J)
MNKRDAYVGIALVAFLVVMVGCVLATSWAPGELTQTDTAVLSEVLFDEYGLAVIIVAFVLFVSMLGGIFIAQEEEE